MKATGKSMCDVTRVGIRTEGTEYRQRGHHPEQSSEELDGIGQGDSVGINEQPVVVPLCSLQMNRIRTCQITL